MKELDVTNDPSVHTCVAETIKEHGCIDVLVNNAGFGARKNTEQVLQACVMNLSLMHGGLLHQDIFILGWSCGSSHILLSEEYMTWGILEITCTGLCASSCRLLAL